MDYTNILFDLDGTLTDPKIGITKSVRYALEKFHISVKDLDELIPFIGPPLAGSFMEFYGMSEAESKQAVEFYREYFATEGIFENQLYDGISALLQLLVKQGRTIILATSKPKVFAEKVLVHFNIAEYFNEIHGSELDGTLTDKGELIQHIINLHHLKKNETIMIGDRKFDIIGAKHNGIDSIGVGYGYGSEAEILTAEPTRYFKTIEELTEALAAFPK